MGDGSTLRDNGHEQNISTAMNLVGRGLQTPTVIPRGSEDPRLACRLVLSKTINQQDRH